MTRKGNLRAVGDGEIPSPLPEPPKTLVEAAERGRRDFLVMARKTIATQIEDGVPAHALGRLIAEMDRLDTEIRKLDALDQQEASRGVVRGDEAFDASAI